MHQREKANQIILKRKMAIDWLDVGFNLVIGLVFLCIMCYVGWQVKKAYDKQRKDKGDEELDQMLKIQKLIKK